ncbi:hypothetical protein SDRG_07063 [Saprolegnia diclina VS20]|uniref:Phosphatidate cytidylyltransferase n=1 Tax=Saprolegnia diclina (strain VS20) TaxID=1156394 RepID=T0QKW0_SAPDV|nr:hypothetical protein SDRG_07063 [Saprolegnia diclina VS20]EQC35351.1 hypothetical protein SDRG_07063 [Saprolegnia diclina VS20]|eukprot:XP_008611101.1 hypothetical protein SDRG_07063 [Saprolegnia diclina VS20]
MYDDVDEELAKSTYLGVPATPRENVSSAAASSRLSTIVFANCPKAHACGVQLGTTIVFLSLFSIAQTYVWDRSAPFFAATSLLLCSYEFFWLAHHSTRTLTASLDPDQSPNATDSCGQALADRFFGGRLILVSLLAGAIGGSAYYGCTWYGFNVLNSSKGVMYPRTIKALGTFTGGGSGLLSVYCPSWSAAVTLICFGAFFVCVSIDAIAYQASLLSHKFVMDNGELYAQGGSLIIALMLFNPAPPIVSLILICHHLVGFMYIFGCCSAISGYIEHLHQTFAVNLLSGVLIATIGASFAQYLWHRCLEKSGGPWRCNIPFVRCLGADSPRLFEILASCLGGILGMFFTTLYVDIVGSTSANVVYTGGAIIFANLGRPFLGVLKQVAGDTPPRGIFGAHGGLLDGLQLFLPLILAFSPYYRVYIGSTDPTGNGTLRN